MQICHLDFLLIPLWYCHFCLKPVWSLTPLSMLSGKSKDLGDMFGPEIFSHSTGWNFEMHPRWAASKKKKKANCIPWSPQVPSALQICGSFEDTGKQIFLVSVFSNRNNLNVTSLPMDVASLWEHHAASAMRFSSPLFPLRQFPPRRWFQQCTRHLGEAASNFWCHTLELRSTRTSWMQILTSFQKL